MSLFDKIEEWDMVPDYSCVTTDFKTFIFRSSYFWIPQLGIDIFDAGVQLCKFHFFQCVCVRIYVCFFGSEIWFNLSTINDDDPTCLLVLQNRLPIYARSYFCLFDFFNFWFINIWIHSRGLWSCVSQYSFTWNH